VVSADVESVRSETEKEGGPVVKPAALCSVGMSDHGMVDYLRVCDLAFGVGSGLGGSTARGTGSVGGELIHKH